MKSCRHPKRAKILPHSVKIICDTCKVVRSIPLHNEEPNG